MASIFRRHEPLRIPQSWKDEARAFVIQLERLLDDIYNKLGSVKEKLEERISAVEAHEAQEPDYIAFGDKTKTIVHNLTDSWTTAIPNDGKPHPVRVYAENTYYFGMINRYSTNYGSAILQYYNGNSYMFYLINGVVTQRRVTPDNEIYWTGTSMSFTSIQGYGYITNQGKNIYLTYPVRRNFVNQSFTNAVVSSFKFSLRGDSGFVDIFSSEQNEAVGTSGYTFTATTRNDNSCILIIIVKTSAFSNVTNNTPIHAQGNLTITFS